MIVSGKNSVNAAFLQGAKQQVVKNTIGQATAPNATPFSALQFGAVTSSASSANTTAASVLQQAQKATGNLLPLNRAVSPSTAVAAQLAAQQTVIPAPNSTSPATNVAANAAAAAQVASNATNPTTAAGASNALAQTAKPSAVDEFMAYVHKTPAQQMADSVLASMGLTQKDLDAMTPDQRAAVQTKIAQKLKEKMQDDATKAGASANTVGVTAFGGAIGS